MVLMNKDPSRGIDVNGKIGVKVPSLQRIGITLMVGGFILIILSFFAYGAVASSKY